MMIIPLKIEETIFTETDKIIEQCDISRNKYINEALDNYNKIQRNKLLEKILKKESSLVSKESIKVLREFEIIEGID
jgi:hypothetical protein